MACLFIIWGTKKRTEEKRAEKNQSRLEKYTFLYPGKKAYEIWEDKNNILYSSKSFRDFFSKFYIERKKKKEHPSISTPQLSLRSSFPSPIGNQGQANKLPNFLSG